MEKIHGRGDLNVLGVMVWEICQVRDEGQRGASVEQLLAPEVLVCKVLLCYFCLTPAAACLY